LKKWGRGGEGGEERDGFSMFWWWKFHTAPMGVGGDGWYAGNCNSWYWQQHKFDLLYVWSQFTLSFWKLRNASSSNLRRISQLTSRFPLTMPISGFGSYRRLHPDDTPTKYAGINPTPCVMRCLSSALCHIIGGTSC
jgi:hypothetical protein